MEPKLGVLRHHREVDVRARLFAEIALANVLDDADDRLRQIELLNVSCLPSGSSPGQRRSAVDCETMTLCPGFSRCSAVVKYAAAQHFDAHRFEVVAGGERHGQRMLRRGFRRALLRGEARSRNPLVQRKVFDDPDGFDAGQRPAAAP